LFTTWGISRLISVADGLENIVDQARKLKIESAKKDGQIDGGIKIA
jgi:hypothetical protein